jgi:gliding motility-associated-like protein
MCVLRFWSLAISLLTSTLLVAQSPDSVRLTGNVQRIPITVTPLSSFTFELTGLTIGGEYVLRSSHSPMNCDEAPLLWIDGLPILSGTPWVAAETSVAITIYNLCQVKQIWLSIHRSDVESIGALSNTNKNANILLGVNVSPEQMIRDHLVGGDCYEISNIAYVGKGRNRGIFANGTDALGVENGIVLGTGDLPQIVPGPNLVWNASFGGTESFVGDLDLNAIYPNTFDVSTLSFDFTPTSTTISFRFVFASEEYCEYVDSEFRDVFGFFISGPGIGGTQNMAVVPFTNIPISIATINHNDYSQYYIGNLPDTSLQVYQPSCLGHPFGTLARVQATQFDGMTTILTASATVVPCQTYRLKIAIADVNDSVYDSAVFMEESSFAAGGTVSASIVFPYEGTNAYEGCSAFPSLVIRRELGDPNITLNIPILIGGTATPDVDYTALPSTVVLPGGIDSLVIPIVIIDDAIVEGQESISITVENSCKCSEQTTYVTILEQQPIELALDSNPICFGEIDTLAPDILGGIAPFTYLWSNGATTSTLPVSTEGIYTVTVTDVCLQTHIVSTTLSVTDSFGVTINQNPFGVTGDTVQLEGLTNLPTDSIFLLTWSPLNHLSDPDELTTFAWPPLNTNYTLSITSTEGCTLSASSLVFSDKGLSVFVPNAFTPNDDSNNDSFWIFGRLEDITEILEFHVYDRWGNELFKNQRGVINDIINGWDGTFRGLAQAPGVYAWYAVVLAYNGEQILYEGDVTLLR